MLEMAIVFPFILIIIGASVDLGRALNQYITITRVVYEATRYASSIGGLEEGTFIRGDAGIPAGHQAIHQRIEILLERGDMDWTNDVNSLQTTLEDNGGALEVKVNMAFNFDAWFDQVNFLDVLGRSEATGPYLYLGGVPSP